MDYVGNKSKGGGKPKHQRGGKGRNLKQINPTRLFITGLIDGMTEDKLKLLFPKCCDANIPKGSIRKGTLYGFVQFTNPADAKSAFEAAKKLTVQTQEGKDGQRITVLYATATKHPKPTKIENHGNLFFQMAHLLIKCKIFILHQEIFYSPPPLKKCKNFFSLFRKHTNISFSSFTWYSRKTCGRNNEQIQFKHWFEW